MKEIQVISYSSTHFALLTISELVAISRNLKIMKTTATQDSQAQEIPCQITPNKNSITQLNSVPNSTETTETNHRAATAS